MSEIRLHRETEQLKQELESCKGYDRQSCYDAIDDCSMQTIYVKTWARFFYSQRRKTSEADHFAIVRRIDLDSDSKISKDEFIEAIKPQEPFSKMLVRQRLSNLEARQPIKSIDKQKKERQSSKPGGHRFSHVLKQPKVKKEKEFKMFEQPALNTRALEETEKSLDKRSISPFKKRLNQRVDGLQDEDHYKRQHVYEAARLNQEYKVSQYSPERMTSCSKGPIKRYSPQRSASPQKSHRSTYSVQQKSILKEPNTSKQLQQPFQLT